MPFNDRLREIRKDLGLNQKEMAKEMAIGYSTYQRYEEGKRMPGGGFFLEMIRKGYSSDWIITGDGDKHRSPTPATEPFLRKIWNWLRNNDKERPGYKNWFEIEFVKRFPEFESWAKKK